SRWLDPQLKRLARASCSRHEASETTTPGRPSWRRAHANAARGPEVVMSIARPTTAALILSAPCERATRSQGHGTEETRTPAASGPRGAGADRCSPRHPCLRPVPRFLAQLPLPTRDE